MCVVQNVFQKNMTQTTWHEEFAESKVMEEKRPQGCVTIATEELKNKNKMDSFRRLFHLSPAALLCPSGPSN